MDGMENNLTKGNILKQLFSFSLPFLISNFLQAMYNVTDTLVVSWFAGSHTVSGVSIGGQITLICTQLAIGFTVGGTVLISQYFGAEKKKELSSTIGTMLTVLAILTAFITAVVIIFAKPILAMVDTPKEAFDEAYKYLVICMSGTIFTFGYNAIAAILRGMGDSKNPLYFVLIAGVVNTLLDIPFVALFHWGAAGDAASTIIAQALALVLAIVYLKRKNFVFDFKLSNFKIVPEKLKQILKIGLPAAVQSVSVGFSFLIMIKLVNGFDVDASAAVGIVGKFNGFAILPAIAMSSAIASMAAQNIGAEKLDRARETMKKGIILALPISLVFCLVAVIVPQLIMGAFTNDANVISKGVEYIRFFSIDYVIVPFLFCINGLLMGAGMATFTMINGILSSLIIRAPIAYLLGKVLKMGLPGIAVAAPIASVVGLILSYCFYKSGAWKRKKLIGAPIILDDLV